MDDNAEFIRFLLRWKKSIVIVFLISGLLSVLISSDLVIKPRYKSFATLYPTNLNSYSEETATEQMLQIFESDFIRDKLISEFNLGEHYGFNPGERYYETNIFETYSEFVNYRKTEYESVEIEVVDYNADTACAIVYALIEAFNEKARRMHRVNELELVKTLKSQLKDKRIELDSVESRLTSLKERSGLLDYKTQAKYATKEYVKLKSGNVSARNQAKELEPLIENLEKEGGKFVLLSNRFKNVIADYSILKQGYEEALKQYNRKLNYVSIVENPHPADKKSYPVRWLIVVISVFASILMLLVFASSYESMKEVKL
jgi:capsule polysaccharide export protein KpsE/RkpR